MADRTLEGAITETKNLDKGISRRKFLAIGSGLAATMLGGCSLPEALKEESLSRGQFETYHGVLEQVIIGGPHGSTDHNASFVRGLIKYAQANGVVATDFYLTPDTRLSVNAPGQDSIEGRNFQFTSLGATVNNEYRRLLTQLANGEPLLYFEMHGNNNLSTMNIEVDTFGITSQEARKLKIIYYEARDKLLIEDPLTQKVDFRINPIDGIYWTGSYRELGSSFNPLNIAKKGFHIEIPHKYMDARIEKVVGEFIRGVIKFYSEMGFLKVDPKYFAQR